LSKEAQGKALAYTSASIEEYQFLCLQDSSQVPL
jgi:hypothetical protein